MTTLLIFFVWSPTYFTGVTKLNKNIGFQKNIFLLRFFPWTLKMQFGQPYWNILVKVLKKLLEVQKRPKRTYTFFKKVVSPQNVPLETQIDFLTSLPNYFCQKLDFFADNVQKWWEENSFFQKNSHRNFIL